MKVLTKRQIEILTFLKFFIDKNKYPPTIREISHKFEISVKGAYDHIQALSKKGVIRCENNRSRTIEVLLNEEETKVSGIEVPLLGRVAAGLPILSETNLMGYVFVSRDMLSSGNHFAVQVKGDSMIGAGIMEGDIALIREQNTAENGDIVVALLDEEGYTLKKFYRETSRIRLEPANPSYSPIFTQNLEILGKLRGIIRSYG